MSAVINEIIKVEPSDFNGETVQTVNARELHSFLEVKSRFNDWIVNRINAFSFVENQDFVTLTKNLVNGGSSKDYFLSLSMAKELCMVERNEKGKKARLYFIECEKNLFPTGFCRTSPVSGDRQSRAAERQN